MQAFRTLAKELIPPVFIKAYKQLNPPRYGWFGNYTNWQQAQQASTGYDSDSILDKVKNALLKVKRGEAAYERDSVLFDTVEYSWPLLASLMWIAARNSGELNVLDFGGSLGSTYFQNRAFLSDLKEVRWNVVEQESFIKCGKMHFEDGQLKFYYSIDSCLQESKPETILLSCVLPYIEKPYELLQSILNYHFQFIIINNTPFLDLGDDRITIQKVPPIIYTASYPSWFLNRQKFLHFFEPHYELVEKYQNDLRITLDGKHIQYEGFIFRRKMTGPSQEIN